MPASRITDGPYPQEGVAHGYRLINGVYNEYDYGEFPTFAAAGNGGVWSSVLELTNYERALTTGLFLDTMTIKQSRQVYRPSNWADTLEPYIGHSWFIGAPKWLADNKVMQKLPMVWHTGYQGGFRSFYFTLPAKKILFTGLFNNDLAFNDMKDFINKGFELMIKYDWFE